MTVFSDALTSDLVIKRVDRVGLLDVPHIEQACFSESWPYSAFGMFVDEPAFLVAAHGDEMLGYVVADVMLNHGDDVGRMKDLAVRLEARGNGLGRQLLVQSLTAMAIVGATAVELEVRAPNDPAIGLYRSLSFGSTHRMPNYYGDGGDVYAMVLDVAEWQRA